MISSNFTLLQEKTPQLYQIATFAEEYVYSDPQSSIAKACLFAERITTILYKAYRIEVPQASSFADLLQNEKFKKMIPSVILYKLNFIRKIANGIVHGGNAKSAQALQLLQEIYEVSKWFAVIALGVKAQDYPDFIAPKPKKQIINEEKINAANIKLQETLDKLEKLKLELAAIKTAKESNKIAIDELKYSEEQTRKHLIDAMIRAAHWNISTDGRNTDEVGQEVEVDNQPTPTGKGRCDYVLWGKDGSPLAVIEAKKTSENADKGKKQASLYADALEKQYGKRPIIFYTNGFETKIWDDANKYPPRTVWGIYSRDSLERLIYQRDKGDIATAQPDPNITGRDYQIRAIKAVCETFSKKQRKALIVQATGTGKTRVSIALSKLLQDKGWAKRILFLCDRNALVKQASRNFNTLLNSVLSSVLKGCKSQYADIVFSTYPTMMNQYAKYDVGYFDLIIADESHRSIYNVYADIFKYFDCLQVGLTATPVDFVNRNTFQLFNCEEGKPTFYYSLEEAIEQGYLVDYVAYRYDTQFLRKGIHYNQLNPEQIKDLEESGDIDKELSVEARSIDTQVMNRPTTKLIIQNLMENGIKDADGQTIGKTIIFARNHDHAAFILSIIDEMYPQYGGKIAAVIDIYDGRAESLIDDFSDKDSPLKIAVSVDMMDTGIDVPEVVNLVFAKPVKSKVKFWQMIGRGTRLCKDLFGRGKDKLYFKIFDHWQNFAYFEQDDNKKKQIKAPEQKSLMQKIFENRIEICKLAQSQQNLDIQQQMVDQLSDMINQLPENSISVKEKWKEKRFFAKKENLDFTKADTEVRLKADLAKLMQWIDIQGHAPSFRFDNLVTSIEKSILQKKPCEDLQQKMIEKVASLPTNLHKVAAKQETINKVLSSEFWQNVTFTDLEEIRQDLRDLMYLAEDDGAHTLPPRILNISEDESQIKFEQVKKIYPNVSEAYKRQITDILQNIIDTEPVIQKIKSGQGLTSKEFDQILSLIMVQNPSLDKQTLKEFFPSTEKLEQILMTISGMDADYIKAKFADFVQKYHLTARQNQFLSMLQNQIIANNGINFARLYQAPFTSLDKNSIDGVFSSVQADELFEILDNFKIEETRAE